MCRTTHLTPKSQLIRHNNSDLSNSPPKCKSPNTGLSKSIQAHVYTHTHTDTPHTHPHTHTHCIHSALKAYRHSYTHTHTLTRHTHTHTHTHTVNTHTQSQ